MRHRKRARRLPRARLLGHDPPRVEVVDEEPDGEHEVFYFPVSADASHGFMIARQAFEGAEWHEGVLHIGLGPVELQIEPTD